jgi:pimeloyl-ACP methyl ester carboxylesterase
VRRRHGRGSERRANRDAIECREPVAQTGARRGAHVPRLRRVRIAGRLFGDGPVGVVLGHSIDGDQTEWWNVAEVLADAGHASLAIDFRGYCPGDEAGCSEDGSTGDAWRDLLAGAKFLRG